MNKQEIKKLVPKIRFPEFEKNSAWEQNKFKKFIKLYRGSSPRPIQDYLTNSNGVNWIKIGDTKNCTRHKICSVDEKITHEGAQKSRFVNSGELILANSMSYGKTYELEIDGCIYDGWFVLREYEKHFDKSFLLQQLNSSLLQQQYEALSAGGVVQNISSDIVYETILSRPSLSEQQKIADCLSSIDDLISAEEEKIKLFKDHKKGLMQNLFPTEGETIPKWRFLEFSDTGDWKETTIEKVVDYENGKAHENDILENGKYVVVNSKFISTDAEVKKYTDSANLLAKKGDILMVLSDVPNGRAIAKCYLVEKDNTYTVNQRICRLIPTKAIGLLLFHIINRNTYFLAFDDGVKQTNLKKEDVLSCPLLLPKEDDEQQKIADCISSLDELITAQSEKIDALKLHKKALMQGLFPSFEEVVDEL